MTRADRLLTPAVFLVAFALYTATLLPDVLPADGGEFQLVAATAGVAHPPGYPLYTMLGWLAAHLPLGPGPAWRVNLLSAAVAAAAVALVFRAGRRVTGSAWGGLVAALTLGSATTFWATATQASIRPLVAFFTALCLDALTAHRPSLAPSGRPVGGGRSATGLLPSSDRYLVIFAAALSLGLTHHASLAFPALAFVAYLLLVDPSLAVTPRRWWRPALAALPGLLVLLYLPLRGAAGAPLAPSDLATLPGFLEHVLARGFRGDMFAFATPEHLPGRLALLPTLLRFQFNPLLLAAAGLGGLVLIARDRRLAVLLLGSFAVHTFVTITYRAPQTVEYEMPAYVSLALLAAAPLLLRPSPPVRSLLVALLLVAGVVNLVAHLPSFATLARTEDTRATVEPILRGAPPNAQVLADWHWATPMWFLQRVEGLRPDLEVHYVYPVPGREYGQVWLEQIEAAPPDRPVVVTHYFAGVEAAGHSLFPLGTAFLVDRPPSPPLAQPLDVVLGGEVRLVGTGRVAADAWPGMPLEVLLAWEPAAPVEEDVALFVHLMGPDGRLWGRGRDRAYPASGLAVGERRVERFTVTPYLHAPPGRYTLVAGAYRPGDSGWVRLTTPDGAGFVTLGELLLHPSPEPPASRHPFLLPLPLLTDPALVGVDYDRSVVGQLRVYLHWRGPSEGEEVWLEGEGFPPQVFTLPVTAEPGHFATAHDLPADARSLRVRVAGRAVRLPAPGPAERYLPFGGEVALVGWEGAEGPLSSGAELAVTFHLMALRPLLHDRHVTARLVGEGYSWWSQDDGTPALGAIPTLKWVRGSRVADRRRLYVPPEAAPGPATLYLGLYDGFTTEPLSILDERFVDYGDVLPVATFTVAPSD